jgi:formamidopyrimidine-DNA glycosylase
MTGSVTIESGAPPRGMDGKHRHVVWTLECGGPTASGELRMAFRDPRRFGGLTAYGSRAELDAAWARLGTDGLVVSSAELRRGLGASRRPIKAALLDQTVVAGVGNIYADESLFAASIHPLAPACSLSARQVGRLAREIRRILNRASDAGGSTLRDYRDAFGQPGSAVQLHAAYGREGEPCVRCKTPLQGLRLQARATVFCPRCQDLSTCGER